MDLLPDNSCQYITRNRLNAMRLRELLVPLMSTPNHSPPFHLRGFTADRDVVGRCGCLRAWLPSVPIGVYSRLLDGVYFLRFTYMNTIDFNTGIALRNTTGERIFFVNWVTPNGTQFGMSFTRKSAQYLIEALTEELDRVW